MSFAKLYGNIFKQIDKAIDKEVVKKLVLAHYKEQIDVMARNKKELQEINKQRTEEINTFFKKLY